MCRGCSALLVWTVLLSSSSLLASAQTFTSQEAGLGLQSQTSSLYVDLAPASIPDYLGPRHIFPGPVGRYTFNLSPSLALEGSVSYLPGFQTSFGVDNGHETLALAGVKAGWRGRRFGLYGKLEPGIASFSPGLNVNIAPGPPDNQRRTNFALDYGTALEYYPSARTILRFDVSQTLLAEYDQVLERTPTFIDLHEGHVAEHLGLAFTIAHRFGPLRRETESVPARRPISAGVLYALQQREHLSFAQMVPGSGIGAWASWNFSRYLALDSTAFYEPKKDGFIFPQDGGTTTGILAGLKAGIRRDHMGYFAAVRPGVIQFSRTSDRVVQGSDYWEKTTDFAIDGGGILEVYPSRHTIFRAEAGNDFIHYHEAHILIEPSTETFYAPARRSSILLLFGAGLRF